MSLRSLVLALMFWGAALPASAACDGPSLHDRLTPQQAATLAARSAATRFGQGLMWQATRDEALLVLVGTMHLADPRHEPLIARLTPEIAAVDLILLEMTPAEEAEMQRDMARNPDRFFITDGPTLPERLDPETWEAVRAAAQARQLPAFLAAKFKPWYLMLSLSIPPCAMADMVSGRLGLDHLVMRAAEAAGTPMRALEPWETVLTLMQAGTEDEQIALLRSSLIDPALQEEMFVAMFDSYFRGNPAEIWELSRIALDFVPGIDPAEAAALFALTEETMLNVRNRSWVPVIESAATEHAATGPTRILIAVGAAHLPGDVGLLHLLEQAGWTIAPLE